MRFFSVSLGNPEAEVISITLNKGEDSRDLQITDTTSHIDVPEQDPSCISKDTIIWDIPADTRKLLDEADEIVITIASDPQEAAGYSVVLMDGNTVYEYTAKALLERAEHTDTPLGFAVSENDRIYRKCKAQYETEDLAQKLEEMLELDEGVLPEEYREVVERSVDDFESALANNDTYWECYWDTAEFVLKDALMQKNRGNCGIVPCVI